jgi:hypothetical protein
MWLQMKHVTERHTAIQSLPSYPMMIDCTNVESMPLARYSIEVLRGTPSFSLRFQFFQF